MPGPVKSALRCGLSPVYLAVNVLTPLGQLFLVAKLVEKLGVGVALALLPALGLAGFAAIALVPMLAMLIASRFFAGRPTMRSRARRARGEMDIGEEERADPIHCAACTPWLPPVFPPGARLGERCFGNMKAGNLGKKTPVDGRALKEE